MNRRGFVLWTILAALVLVGAVEAAAMFEALHEQHAAENAEAALVAQSAAASGLAIAAAQGVTPAAAVLGLDDSARVAAGGVSGGAYDVGVQRVGARLFRAAASGNDLRLGLERDLTTTLRLVPLLPAAPPAALVVRIAPDAALLARISGADTSVSGWRCPAPSSGGAAVRVAAGTPDSTFFALGPMRWPALRAWAGVAGRSVDSLEVRFSHGDLELNGVRALGTVVVDGSLTLRGGASVTGLAVVTGTLVFGPGGGSILGGVITNQTLLAGAAPSEVRVGYSECARGVAGALWAPLEPIQGLPWVAFR